MGTGLIRLALAALPAAALAAPLGRSVSEWARLKAQIPDEGILEALVAEESSEPAEKGYELKVGRASFKKDAEGRAVEGRPLYVLISGSIQTLDLPPERSLAAAMYAKLLEEGHNAVWFRSGDWRTELRDLLRTWRGYVSSESELIAHFRQRALSQLTGRLKPSEVRILGYSWGGGVLGELAENPESLGGAKVSVTVMVDAIERPKATLGEAHQRRPDFGGNVHMHLYQRGDRLLRGAPPLPRRIAPPRRRVTLLEAFEPDPDQWGKQSALGLLKRSLTGRPPPEPVDSLPGDVVREVPGMDHITIDSDEKVREEVYRFLTQELK